MAQKHRILAVIPARQGYHVVVGQAEFMHALEKHFFIPVSVLLLTLETVLRDPTVVFVDDTTKQREHHILYRLEIGGYLAVVVKLTGDGVFFCSMYPTGKTIRAGHKKMKRLKL